jgi:hypothetical protein
MNASTAHRLGAAALCGAACAIWACASGSEGDGATSVVGTDAGPDGPAGPETSAGDGRESGPTSPTDVGQPCTQGSECLSGLCSLPQGIDAGAGVCSEPCLSASDCVPGWTCDPVGPSPVASGSGGQGVCECTPVPETCDGKDDNCDGKIDEEPAADEACSVAAGVPEKCVKGACVCVVQCGGSGTCINLSDDPNNCGACGHACLAGVQVCSGSECICGGLLCPVPPGDAGYVPPDGGADGGPVQCVQSASDPDNCGACGVVCPSPYKCQSGACQAIELVQGSSSTSMSAVVSDGTDVFVLTSTTGAGGTVSGTIEECAVAGCSQNPTTVAPDASNATGAGLLTVGGSWVYWSNTTVVEDLATANPAPTPFAQPMGSSVYAVATSSTYVFWSDTNLGILLCAIGSTCASPQTLLALASISGPPLTIAADETYVYWTDANGNLFSSPVAGGTPSTLATDAYAYGAMVAAAGRVYYVDDNAAIGTAVGGTASSGTTYFASVGAKAFATDGTTLYWADDTVRKCPLGPSCAAPTVLAAADSPTWVAVDATRAYWIATDAQGFSGVYEFRK